MKSTCDSQELLQELLDLKQQMSLAFTMKDLKEVHYYLGIHVVRLRDMNQTVPHLRMYIDEVLRPFNMAECNAVRNERSKRYPMHNWWGAACTCIS